MDAVEGKTYIHISWKRVFSKKLSIYTSSYSSASATVLSTGHLQKDVRSEWTSFTQWARVPYLAYTTTRHSKPNPKHKQDG